MLIIIHTAEEEHVRVRLWLWSICIYTLFVAPISFASTPQPSASSLFDDAETVAIPRTEVAPEIDGVLEPEAWSASVVIESLRQVEPNEGGEPSERTSVHLMYDATTFYVGIRCYDREPGEIRANQMKRDVSLGTDDFVQFVIDPFYDRRNGYFFEMNPLGARGDALIEDNGRFRRDWDGIWEGRASIDEESWTAEFAIPLQTISFDPTTSNWGFNVARFIRRHNELMRWATPSQDRGISSMADAGTLTGLEDLEEAAGFDVKPYLLTTIKRDHDQDDSGIDFNAGVDIFYRPTPLTTLALTFNTDFAETEVDERRINLTRFPLFFPEKRDFFLQDAGIFNFGGINRNPLPFHSRRIGLGPSGEQLDILAGVKFTGRVGGVNLGLLDVQMKHDETLGHKNLFVGRASVNVLEQSTVGAILTAGDPTANQDHYLGGLDFNYRDTIFPEKRVIEAHVWMQYGDTPGVQSGEAAYGFKLRYPNDRIRWGCGYSEIQENFNAALGFVPRRAIREYFANWRYRWRPEHTIIRSIDFGTSVFMVTDLHNEVESRSLELEPITLRTEAGDRFWTSVNFDREVFDEEFEISDGVIVPPGDYRFDRYAVGFSTTTDKPLNVSASYRWGEFLSGDRRDWSVGFDWRPSPGFTLGADYSLNDIDLPEGSFITRLLQCRCNLTFTPDVSWSTFIQYDNVSESIGLNSKVRWTFAPGSDMYIVLNQAIDREVDSYRVVQSELTTKVGWTFRF